MPAKADSVWLARHRVARLLLTHGWDEEVIDEISLMTTELATNAVEHAQTAYTLTVDLSDTRGRFEIHDGSPALPVLTRRPAPMAAGGRGLRFVANLADRWGHRAEAGGKSVWFEVAGPVRGAAPSSARVDVAEEHTRPDDA